MTRSAVQASLLERPDQTKEIRLIDGSRIVVQYREQWLAGPDYLIVLVGRFDRHIAYHNIAAIYFGARNGRRVRRRK